MPKTIKPFISPVEIKTIVKGLAERIREDYHGKNPVFICVLKGAFIFMSDLMREVGIPVEAVFIRSSTYGKRDAPSKKAALAGVPAAEIKDRDIIIVEGIVDRGVTIKAVIERLQSRGPSSIKVCTLLLREDRTESGPVIHYSGRTMGDGFVVGYGMDYMEKYRELPGLYLLKD